MAVLIQIPATKIQMKLPAASGRILKTTIKDTGFIVNPTFFFNLPINRRVWTQAISLFAWTFFLKVNFGDVIRLQDSNFLLSN